ncbi:MAG: hypothetical protein HC836_40645 [Richelia sp. RM2_1_2]|nr:hypothetical protein [Richelia sp. RM2_1_2]
MKLKEFQENYFINKCEEYADQWHDEFLLLLSQGKVTENQYDQFMKNKIDGVSYENFLI